MITISNYQVAISSFAFAAILLFAHWLSVYVYSTYCVPTTFLGIFISFFTAGSPVCQLVNVIQNKTLEFYTTIFGSLAIAAASCIFGLFKLFANKLFKNEQLIPLEQQ